MRKRKKFLSALFAMMLFSGQHAPTPHHQANPNDDNDQAVHHDGGHHHEPHGEHETDGPENDFVYEYDKELDGMVITGYKGKHTKIHIPHTLEGKPVVIVHCPFRNNVTMLDFPDTVIRIWGLPKSLRYFNIPKGVSYLKDDEELLGEAELNLPHLEKIKVHGHSHKISEGGVKIRLKDGVLRILGKDFSFYHIMKGTPAISPREFADCTDLVRIYIPSTVREIGEHAFRGCTALQSVILSHDTLLPDNAFDGCDPKPELIYRKQS